MRRVIRQSVSMPSEPTTLFDMYLDPRAHASITGYPVTIDATEGAEFRAFDGQLSGHILALLRPQLIVQSWRSTKFHGDDPDSTLILAFTPDEADVLSGSIDLIHLDVPDHDFQDVTEGWQKYYWAPWRAYLERQAKQIGE